MCKTPEIPVLKCLEFLGFLTSNNKRRLWNNIIEETKGEHYDSI